MTRSGGVTRFGVQLYPVDCASLESGQCLTSNVLSYCFAKAQSIVAEDATRRTVSRGDARERRVLFLDTSVAQAMLLYRDLSIGPLAEMQCAELLVIPVAHYTSKTADGLHWCTLILLQQGDADGTPPPQQPPPAAFVADSSGTTGKADAQAFLDLLRTEAPATSWLAALPAEVTVMRHFPQQANSVDCGAYVCVAALMMAERIAASPNDSLRHCIAFAADDISCAMVKAYRDALRGDLLDGA